MTIHPHELQSLRACDSFDAVSLICLDAGVEVFLNLSQM